MRVSDYIVFYLKQKGISAVFGYPGGMLTYLLDSFQREEGIAFHTNYHEQASSFCACGYAQISGKAGVACATSGPGATNLVTGICNAYYDSIPTIFFTGQVNTYEAKGDMRMRQKGFQETDIVGIAEHFTKYSVLVDRAEDIKYHLDKAFARAMHGRKGPCLLDIPMNIQRTEIQTEKLEGYQETEQDFGNAAILQELSESLEQATRPLVLFGNGINIAEARAEFRAWIHASGIPSVSSMLAVDVLSRNDRNYFGFIGAYGNRYANYCLYHCDLLIVMGARLDTRQTGVDLSNFTSAKKVIRIDIDECEFDNKVHPQEKDFIGDIKGVLAHMNGKGIPFKSNGMERWIQECRRYREELENIDDSEPNRIVAEISRLIPDGAVITTDVGQNQVWVAQSFCVQDRQRILFSGGHGAMGYALPAAIGAYYATKKPVYCFTGDGGLQMNLQELQYIVRERIPIKIVLLNNHALGMIRHFQEMYFEGHYTQTVQGKGYDAPNFCRLAKAYGVMAESMVMGQDVSGIVENLNSSHPFLLEVLLEGNTYVYPKLAVGKPIYMQEPPLPSSLREKLDNPSIEE